ncbi:M48 family metallopeptidase [Ferrimonas pelagia]|uniref:M48 family metallopeptidase n=1 Tax=Ferrimonas pelagia TaxID=1177826 RepID=A0ABP9F3Z8_9GAMM
MDFFAQQDQARKRTGQLVFLFACAVISIVVLINALIAGLMIGSSPQAQRDPLTALLDRMLSLDGAMISLGIIAVIALVSLFKWLALRSGGSAVAESLGGRRISPNTEDPDERRLRNVVEEMALAAGMPVPQIYLLDHENGINAFAAGHGPADAVIGVTRGCLKKLDRDQLQGVMAHEFSHILNGDMRLNLRLMAILAGIIFLSQIGELIMHAGRGRSKDAQKIAIVGIALLILGWIGTLFGKAIKAAVSRQREYLADASAVQFTRNPSGIADALKLIGADSHASNIEHPKASESSHLFFGSFKSLSSAFATHPPLEKRIYAIQPQWDGQYASVVKQMQQRTESTPPTQPQTSSTQGQQAERLTQLLTGALLLDQLPQPMQQRAHEPEDARELVLALLWPRHGGEHIADLDSSVIAAINQLKPQLEGLTEQQQLCLVQLAIPSLNELSAPQKEVLLSQLSYCWQLDDQGLLRWCVWQVLRHYLTDHHSQRSSDKQIKQAAACLMGLLAHVGHQDMVATKAAYHRGTNSLGDYLSELPGSPQWQQAAQLLPRLRGAKPERKRRLMTAFKLCVEHDGQITEQEAVLLHCLALLIDAPTAQ